MATNRFVHSLVSVIRVALLLVVTSQMAISDAAARSLDSALSPIPVNRPQPADSQPQIVPPRLEVVGQFGGTLTAFAVSGELAYGGVGPRMKILDISDPTDLRVVGETGVLPAMLVDLAVSGRYVYVAMRDYGIRIFDVVDPTAPVAVGSFSQTDLKIRALVVEGGHIYLTHDAGLSILDISDPTAPVALSTVPLPAPDGGREMVVVDQIVYVAAYRGGVRIVDASDPSAPIEVGFLQTASSAQDLAVIEPTIYVVTSNALVSIDAADLTNPVQISSYPINEPTNVAVANSYAYVTANYAMIAFNVAAPALPVQVSVTDLFQNAVDLVVDDRFIYAAGQYGFQVFLPTQPTSPPAVGFFATMGDISALSTPPVEMGRMVFPSGRVTDITVAGDFVYTTGDTRLLSIFDVADPTTPTEVGRVDRPYPNPYPENDIEVANGYAYVVDNGLLHIFNITDPAQPVGIAHPLTISHVTDVAIAGDYAYAAGEFADLYYGESLYSIDIQNPEQPRLADSVAIAWTGDEFLSRTVTLAGQFAYVGGAFNHWREGNSGNLVIVDISNPEQLAEAGDCRIGAVWSLATYGNYVYATTSSGRLGIYNRLYTVDVSNPLLPTWVARSDAPYRSHILVAGQRAYLTSSGGLTVFDIRHPLAPVPLLTEPLMGWPTRATVDGDHVYVATEAAGFFIYRYVEPPALPQSWLPVILRP